ncbi:hypothetical protein KEM55_002082, partial [Ascosphaera atra]
AGLEFPRHELGLQRLLARDGDDAADPLGDAALLEDDELLDIARLRDVGTAAELDGDAAPAGVRHVLQNLLDLDADGDDAHGVRICLPEDGADARDVAGERQGQVLGVDAAVLANVLGALVLDGVEVLV